MTPMVDFTEAMLHSLGEFLSTEPGIYLFGVTLMIGLVKVIKSLTS